mmetsp:Transcript_3488/g.4634  ORF Transcript_3488/g.4634 Transcript_3488/m.4634 type:complete len:179 (-) Transcript_3488:801-1337(-)
MDRLQAKIEYNDMFISKFGAFQTEMDGKVDYAQKEYDTMSVKADKLIAAYGCNPNDYKPKDLFELFFNFARDFSDAFKKLEAKIKAEEEKLKKAGKKKSRATVSEENPKNVKEMIQLWKGKMAQAEELKDFGINKKQVVEEKKVDDIVIQPKPVKKATRVSKSSRCGSSARGGSVARE